MYLLASKPFECFYLSKDASHLILRVVEQWHDGLPVCTCPAAAGEAQGHGQYGRAAAAVWGGRSGLRRSAGGLHTAVPVPAAALQRHAGTSNAAQTADQGNNCHNATVAVSSSCTVWIHVQKLWLATFSKEKGMNMRWHHYCRPKFFWLQAVFQMLYLTTICGDVYTMQMGLDLGMHCCIYLQAPTWSSQKNGWTQEILMSLKI